MVANCDIGLLPILWGWPRILFWSALETSNIALNMLIIIILFWCLLLKLMLLSLHKFFSPFQRDQIIYFNFHHIGCWHSIAISWSDSNASDYISSQCVQIISFQSAPTTVLNPQVDLMPRAHSQRICIQCAIGDKRICKPLMCDYKNKHSGISL